MIAEQGRAWLRRPASALAWSELALPVTFAAMCIALALLHPRFLTWMNIENVSRQWAFLMILATAQMFAILSGGIDLSSGAVVGLVSVVTTLTLHRFGIAPGIVAGMLAGTLLGSANGVVIARLKVPPMIVTLAMASFGVGLALTITGGMPIQQVPLTFSVIGRGWVGPLPAPTALAMFTAAVSLLLLRYTRFGRHVYAVGGSEETALLSGVDVDRLKIQVYVLVGFVAAAGGVALSSLVVTGDAHLGEGLEFQAIAAVALGGTRLGGGEGGVTRTVFGALFIAVLANGLNLLNVPTYYQWLLVGTSLIIALLLQRART